MLGLLTSHPCVFVFISMIARPSIAHSLENTHTVFLDVLESVRAGFTKLGAVHNYQCFLQNE